MNRNQARQSIASKVVRTSGGAPTPAPVGRGVVESGDGTLSIVLDNSGGASTLTYILGDGGGVYAAASGLTLTDPDSGDIDPAAMNASFSHSPVTVKAINYSVTVSEAQFSKPMNQVAGFRNGNSHKRKINTAVFRSSADNNTKVRNLVFDEGDMPYLSFNTGLSLDVGAGETVNLELTIHEGRY